MSDPLRVGLLCSRLRVEEKLLRDALVHRGLDVEIVDDRELSSRCDAAGRRWDAVLERSLSQTRGLALLRVFESWGLLDDQPSRGRRRMRRQARHVRAARGSRRADARDDRRVQPRGCADVPPRTSAIPSSSSR